jgi:hypothetical protein
MSCMRVFAYTTMLNVKGADVFAAWKAAKHSLGQFFDKNEKIIIVRVHVSLLCCIANPNCWCEKLPPET